MMVMPANSGYWKVHYWQGKYGGLGHLYSPAGERGPFEHLPYALDNGRFAGGPLWSVVGFRQLVHWAREAPTPPMWVAVPDVVGDAKATLLEWRDWEEEARGWGIPLALVVQDGMSVEDARECGADWIFIGGSTAWKWGTLESWCAEFPRVHVGRVNGHMGLVRCYRAGAMSCDGTGWFRGDKGQLIGLEAFLRQQSQGCVPQITPSLFQSDSLPTGENQ
jgi:hypothetical protein